MTQFICYSLDECNRLRFIQHRDGIVAAIEFATQLVKQYRKAVLQSARAIKGNRMNSYPTRTTTIHHASLPEYRERYIRSYLQAKNYIQLAYLTLSMKGN